MTSKVLCHGPISFSSVLHKRREIFKCVALCEANHQECERRETEIPKELSRFDGGSGPPPNAYVAPKGREAGQCKCRLYREIRLR
jgi:hypothetical protein